MKDFEKRISQVKRELAEIENVARMLVAGQCTDTEFLLTVLTVQNSMNTVIVRAAEQLAETHSTENTNIQLNVG